MSTPTPTPSPTSSPPTSPGPARAGLSRIKPPRLAAWMLIALALLAAVWAVAPQQFPVSLYKLSLVTLAAVVGYWIDRSLFPYARPDSFLWSDWRNGTDAPDGDVDFPIADADYMAAYCTAQLRRAVVVGCVVLGVAVGL